MILSLIKSNLKLIALLLFGIMGLIASFYLTIENFELLKNPNHISSCDLSNIFSCSKLISVPESMLFGFPNPILGIMGYTSIITLAIILLLIQKYIKDKVIFEFIQSQFFKFGTIFASLAFAFSYWLLYTSSVKYNAICPYCLTSAFASTNIFFIFLASLLQNRKIYLFAIFWSLLISSIIYIKFFI